MFKNNLIILILQSKLKLHEQQKCDFVFKKKEKEHKISKQK